MEFAHLHVHTEYSVLDGLSRVKKLVSRAKEYGMPALAITDHGNMLGVTDFFNTAKAAGVKPIIGMETYVAARGMTTKEGEADRSSAHLLLLAENKVGYQNLIQIATASQLEGFYYHPRIDHAFLETHAEGLIAASACISGEIPRAIVSGGIKSAIPIAQWYLDLFGKDRFFVEVQDHKIPGIHEINQSLLEIAEFLGGRVIATNDVHYIDRADAKYQDVLLAIQTNKKLEDENRLSMQDDTYYLRTAEEMERLFGHIPEALSNTLEIAERCNVDLTPDGYLVPQFPVSRGQNSESFLRDLCETGFSERYGSSVNDPVFRERLEYELGVIHKMGFDDYFLIVWDLCKHAREKGIWYNTRGSAAGSMVAYTLGITTIEPIRFKLIFERFLNPSRVSMPDIDLDFQDDRRSEMMTYVTERYGDERVASIITYGKMKARSAIRDVGRVMGMPLNKVDKIAKMVPGVGDVTVKDALDEIAELKEMYNKEQDVKELIDTAQGLDGTIRSLGTHACGVLITPDKLTNHVALHRPTNGSSDIPIKQVAQCDMGAVDVGGLLKVDFLGLSTLTICNRACAMINERHGLSLDLATIPTDDPETYDLLGKGDTTAVFQLESAGMKRYLREMKPDRLENAIAMVALYRPGPIDFIPHYIARMHGEEPIEYKHPDMAKIFDETYGIPVYQEQIMSAAIELAGYTAPESDTLRKAISKKKVDKIEEHRKKFVKGCIDKGIAEETATAIFAEWEKFARYGFNKAHAAVYGVVAVKTAWLKTHYYVEFMAAALSVFRDASSKIAGYTADCRNHGVNILPPDINKGESDFTIEQTDEGLAIRFGMSATKNVGVGSVAEILLGRGMTPFKDISDFVSRVNVQAVGKKAIESLIKVGAFDCLGKRDAILAALDDIMRAGQSNKKSAVPDGQINLFSVPAATMIKLPKVEILDEQEHLAWERELLGLYVSGHPLDSVSSEADAFITHYSDEIQELYPNSKVTLVGITSSLKKHIAKNGKAMAFVVLEDLHGEVELTVFPNIWQRTEELFSPGVVLVIDGKVEDVEEGKLPKILVDRVYEIHEATPDTLNSSTRNNVALSEADSAKALLNPAPTKSSGLELAEQREPRTVRVKLPPDYDIPMQMRLAKRVLKRVLKAEGKDTFAFTFTSEASVSEIIFPNLDKGMNAEIRKWIPSVDRNLLVEEYD